MRNSLVADDRFADQGIGLDLDLAGELIDVFPLFAGIGAVGAGGELLDRVEPHRGRMEAGLVVLGQRPAAVADDRTAAGARCQRHAASSAIRNGR